MSSPIISSQFIYEFAPFPSCHASTIVQTPGGIVAAFFGGTHEKNPDVCIWVSHLKDGTWTAPVEVANGVMGIAECRLPIAELDASSIGNRQSAFGNSDRQPTWNPVLFQPRSGPLMLFYKVGPHPSQWRGMVKTSDDGGHTWSEATRLPDGILGPIKNKPVQLDDGQVISPTSVEGKEIGWRVYFELSGDGGKTWTATRHVEQDANIKAIQPSVLVHSQTKLQAIGRTRSGRLFETWSNNAGRSWEKLRLTDLPNCNSGTDAVTLSDGRHVLVYNHSSTEKVRVPLNVAVSKDGRVWEAAAVLESEPPGQYSYPAVIQSADGLVHVTYTWKRLRIKHAVLDPRKF